MSIDDNIKDEKLQYELTENQQKNQYHHQVKLINLNILHVKKT